MWLSPESARSVARYITHRKHTMWVASLRDPFNDLTQMLTSISSPRRTPKTYTYSSTRSKCAKWVCCHELYWSVVSNSEMVVYIVSFKAFSWFSLCFPSGATWVSLGSLHGFSSLSFSTLSFLLKTILESFAILNFAYWLLPSKFNSNYQIKLKPKS